MEMKFNLRLINIPTICFGEFAIVDVRSMKWKIVYKVSLSLFYCK